MSPEPIMITPKGYDDVNTVLRRLGGRLANTRQLNASEMRQLERPAFLSGVRHLFFNCASSITASPAAISTIRDFVDNGGTLYASDWASSVIEAAFDQLVEFSPREGRKGIVQTKVSDPYLAQRLGNSIAVNFDMDEWVLIKKFPTSADVYIMDMNRKPLAVGFRVGRGRVVFTSFHHHAQQSGSGSALENALLEWLVSLPTQHQLLISTGLTLAQHRVTSSKQMMGRAGNERQVMPVNPGRGKGLGVFVLSWDRDPHTEFSMRYLRGREVAEAEQRSSNPPLVMTVRDPDNNDGVEVRRHVSDEGGLRSDELKPFVLGSGMRRDLLGDPDWFASAIIRNVQIVLEGNTSLDNARQSLTASRIGSVVQTILHGLGYQTSPGNERAQPQSQMEIRAWAQGASAQAPDILADVVVAQNQVASQGRETADTDAHPIHGELAPGTERLLIVLTFSREDTDDPSAEERRQTPRTSDDRVTWRAVCSENLTLGRDRDTISAQEFLENYHASITVYRAEYMTSQTAAEL